MPEISLPSSTIEDSVRSLPSFLPALDLPQVRIRDREAVEKKLRKMVDGGAEKLMVISDFDFTLSRFEDEDGSKCWTTHGVFDNFANEYDPSLGAKFTALRDKYFPIEFCPTLTMEEKIPHMEMWWKTSHDHIVEARFKKACVESFVQRSKILLRENTDEMISRLESSRVPLVIFSAGIGNIIEIFLAQRYGRMPSNAHLISNMMQFDDENKVCGFSEPLIHTFCKNSSIIRKEAEFFHEFNGRTNVVLLGDSMGDIHMDVGVETDGPTLKIGFLNANVNNLLDHYMDVYDIVLVLDSTMTVPSQIIELITRN